MSVLRSAVVDSLSVLLASSEAAQRERQRAELARQRERLGLARGEFQRRGLADDDALAVFLFDRLVDRQHADVGQDRFARSAWRRRRSVVALRVARERMTSTRSFGRMKPPAPVSGEISVETARMPDGRIAAMKPAEPLALISLASRIGSPAANGARAIGAVELLDGVRLVFLGDVAFAGGRRRPGLPLQILAGRSRCPCRCRSWRSARRSSRNWTTGAARLRASSLRRRRRETQRHRPLQGQHQEQGYARLS